MITVICLMLTIVIALCSLYSANIIFLLIKRVMWEIIDPDLFWFDFKITNSLLKVDMKQKLEVLTTRKKVLEALKNRINQHYSTHRRANRWNSVLERCFPFSNSSNRDTISRSFHKLKEILIKYEISGVCSALCLCEAPGGFLQYILDQYEGVVCRAVSISDSIEFSRHIKLSPTLVYMNILTQSSKMRWKRVDLVTADGGIDCSHDYTNQEIANTPIIIQEIEVCRHNLRIGGTFVVKIFDMYTTNTYRIIVWLTRLFGTLHICKPPTSKPSNSEKYLVCLGFNGEDVSLDEVKTDGKTIPNLVNWINQYTIDLQIKTIGEILDKIESPPCRVDNSKLSIRYKQLYPP